MNDCTVRCEPYCPPPCPPPCAPCPPCPPCVSQKTEPQTASLTKLRVSAAVEAKASLTVRTDEGDTVTLSAGRAARADLSSIAYDKTGRSIGATGLGRTHDA